MGQAGSTILAYPKLKWGPTLSSPGPFPNKVIKSCRIAGCMVGGMPRAVDGYAGGGPSNYIGIRASKCSFIGSGVTFLSLPRGLPLQVIICDIVKQVRFQGTNKAHVTRKDTM